MMKNNRMMGSISLMLCQPNPFFSEPLSLFFVGINFVAR